MQTTKILFTKAFETLYGPHRKRYPSSFFLDQKKIDSQSVSIFDGLVDIRILGSKYEIQFKPAALNSLVIEKLNLAGWDTVINFQDITVGVSDSIVSKLVFDSNEILRVKVGSAPFSVLGFFEQRNEDFFKMPTWNHVVSARLWLARLLSSGVLHFALIAGAFFLKEGSLPWFHTDEQVAKAIEEQKQAVTLTPVEVEMIAKASDFGGRNFAYQETPTEVNSEQKIAKVSNSLSNLAQRLSGISFSGAVAKVSSHSAGAVAGAVGSIQGSIQSGAVSGSFNKDLQVGKVGGNMGWSIGSASGGVRIDPKDQLELVRSFSAAQGQIRSCYETVVLSEPDLSVVVQYDAMISSGGGLGTPSFKVQGAGSEGGKQKLIQCMKSVLNQIRASKNLSGTRVKNEFIFRL